MVFEDGAPRSMGSAWARFSWLFSLAAFNWAQCIWNEAFAIWNASHGPVAELLHKTNVEVSEQEPLSVFHHLLVQTFNYNLMWTAMMVAADEKSIFFYKQAYQLYTGKRHTFNNHIIQWLTMWVWHTSLKQTVLLDGSELLMRMWVHFSSL
jgi:hypothetical protein